MTLLHETGTPLERTGQRYARTRTHDLAGRKVRTTVDLDTSYPNQSRIKAELWDGTRWNQVVRIEPTDEALGEIASGYLPVHRSDEKLITLDLIDTVLISRTLDVIG